MRCQINQTMLMRFHKSQVFQQQAFVSADTAGSNIPIHMYLVQGLRTPGEEIAFTARPKIKSQSQIHRYGRSLFCLPHQPKISGFFDLCHHFNHGLLLEII